MLTHMLGSICRRVNMCPNPKYHMAQCFHLANKLLDFRKKKKNPFFHSKNETWKSNQRETQFQHTRPLKSSYAVTPRDHQSTAKE